MLGKHLKVKSFGTNTLGVKLEGDKNNPEPYDFIVETPLGHMQIARCANNDYWLHFSIKDANLETIKGKFIDARIDSTKEPTKSFKSLVDKEGVYHIAIKLTK